MCYKKWINQCCLYFSRWSKKGYSIFIGLGREVHISRLALHMYKNVLLKSASCGVIVNMDKISEEISNVLIRICGGKLVPVMMGEVDTDYSYKKMSQAEKGYIATQAVYPFLFEI